MPKKPNHNERPLTPAELDNVVPLIRNSLIGRYNRGIRSPISGKDMCSKLRDKAGIVLNPSRLRKMIHHIAVAGLPVNLVLCASNKGYFVTTDSSKVQDYKNSLEHRLSAMLRRFRAVERDLAALENRKQLKITELLNEYQD